MLQGADVGCLPREGELALNSPSLDPKGGITYLPIHLPMTVPTGIPSLFKGGRGSVPLRWPHPQHPHHLGGNKLNMQILRLIPPF